MDLNKIRRDIDAIDNKMLELLSQRAHKVIKVNEFKVRQKLDNYSPAREAHIFKRLKALNKGPLDAEDVEMVFREVVSVCRAVRTALRAAYLGPQGTFTHLAALKKFGKKAHYLPAENIREVFDKVEKGEVDYGVVPIENTIEGVVNYTQDMFFASPLQICAEITMTISHNLLSNASRSIKRIYSNPHVFPQCRQWITKRYPGAELVPVSSTAKAAQLAKKDPQGACIGNKILSEIYGLKIVDTAIEDSASNMTRFLVIAKKDSAASGKDKTSLLFSVKDRVGALYDVLSAFKRYRINLTKIESRPSRRKPWDYYFLVDCEGHRDSALFKKAMREVEKHCVFVKVLGSYPKES